MTRQLRKGDRVEWNSHGGKKTDKGKAHGVVEKKLTEKTEIKGHTAKASEQEPQYLVKSDNGGSAAHKPSSLRKTTK
jgi:hypothetical protein